MKYQFSIAILFLNLVVIYGNPIPEIVDSQATSSSTTTTTPAPPSTSSSTSTVAPTPTEGDNGHNETETTVDEDLNELQGIISPKLFMFLQRLAFIDPELLQTGEARLATLKLMGVDEVDEIINTGAKSPDELRQFQSDLAKVSKLVSKYPEIKKLIHLSLTDDDDDTAPVDDGAGGAIGSTPNPFSPESFLEEVDPFFEEFTRIDKDLSKYPEWNRYWTYWFKRYGDYMAKYG